MFYKILFNINIHHGFFLDSSNKKFLSINPGDQELSDSEKEQALKQYTTQDYLTIIPTPATLASFKDHRMILRPHAQGFRVLIDTMEEDVLGETKYTPIIPLDDDQAFTFELQATDPYFYNYTKLTDITKNRLYAFVNAVPVNQNANFENIFDNTGGPIDNSFLLKARASRDLIQEIAQESDARSTTVDPFSITRVIQLIEEDDNLTPGQKIDQIKDVLNSIIQEKRKKNVIGYIRLSAKGDTAMNDQSDYLLEFDDTDPDDIKQYILDTTPEFTLSFVNQKTFWRYRSLANDATLTTKNKKWSSRNGFIDIKTGDFEPGGLDPPDTDPEDYYFPNPTFETVLKEGNDYYSEILI